MPNQEGDSSITVLSVESDQRDLCVLIRNSVGLAIVLPSCVIGTPREAELMDAAMARIAQPGRAS